MAEKRGGELAGWSVEVVDWKREWDVDGCEGGGVKRWWVGVLMDGSGGGQLLGWEGESGRLSVGELG